MKSGLSFEIYARIFNRVLTSEGYPETDEEIIRPYWKNGDDPDVAAHGFLAEEEEFD